MRDDHRRVFLERRRHGSHRDVLLDGGEHLQRVAHHDVELPGGQKLEAVDLWPAHADGDVEAVLPVSAFRDGLIEAPVLRLREPVGGEHDLVRLGGMRREAQGRARERDERAVDPSNHRSAPAWWRLAANRHYAQLRAVGRRPMRRPKTASRRWRPTGIIRSMPLDSDACYRALAAHDPRFDGRFFVGVSSTRIYCRPVCTVRLPRRENCRFFASAAAAEVEGYRPCMRCRPELAPGNASVDSVARLAQGAIDLIENGVLEAGGIEHLASRVGVTSRHLRRIFETEFGVSPIEYAQTQRLLLAKRLLTDTTLPVTEIASASGFASVRRFNALFKARYRMSPGRLREARGSGGLPGRARVRARVPSALRLGCDAFVPGRTAPSTASSRWTRTPTRGRSRSSIAERGTSAGSRCGARRDVRRSASRCRRRSLARSLPCCRA